MEGKVRKLFYEMYPDSDPKYYGYFSFGDNVDGDKLTSIDVWYTHNLKYNDYIQIIKGKNDKDPRWRKYLHHKVDHKVDHKVVGDKLNFPKIWRLGGTVQKFTNYQRGPDRRGYVHPRSYKYTLPYQLHNFRLYVNDKE